MKSSLTDKSNEISEMRKKSLTNVSVFILFFLIWFSLFRFTGSFTRGYNIYEDYLVIKTNTQLDSGSLVSVTYNFAREDVDVRSRFRIFFSFYKVLSIKLFGNDLILHTIFSALLGILTSFFLFKFGIEAGFTKPLSLLFGILIFTGPEVIAWTDFSGSENFAMLFLALALFYSMKSINAPREKSVYKILFTIFLFFASITKENFILMIPAVLFLYLLTFGMKYRISIFASVKKNIVLLSMNFFVMTILLLSIFIFVGLNNQGYTGVDTDKLNLKTIFNFIESLFSYRIFIVILSGMFIVFISDLIHSKSKDSSLTHSGVYFFNAVILFLLIVFPQYITYIKTGLVGRYLLPFIMGFSLLLLFVIKYIFESKSILPFLKYLYLALVFIFIFFEIKDYTIPPLLKFTNECNAATGIANSIINKEGNDSLLFILDPVQNFHEVYSFKTYLSSLSGQRDYKYGFIKDSYIHPYFAGFYSDSVQYKEYMGNVIEEFGSENLMDSLKNMNNIKNIFLFTRLRRDFLEQNKYWFDETKFVKQNFGRFTFYSKN